MDEENNSINNNKIDIVNQDILKFDFKKIKKKINYFWKFTIQYFISNPCKNY